MRVADVMTLSVVTVRPSASVREVARILLDHGISAVPVVDEQDRPVGIVSEGDLVRRVEIGTETKRSSWLDLLGDSEDCALRFVKEHGHTAEQVMSRELVTTSEEAGLAEVAHLLEKHRIRRLPVLRDGRIVGVVSRADILRGFASAEPELPTRVAPGDDREIRKGGSGRSCERGRRAGPSQRHGIRGAGAALGGPQRRRRARSLESVTISERRKAGGL